jgi:hypothetical protein
MNQDINPLDLIARDLSQSASPTILLPINPSLDMVHASLALYIALAKIGKAPSVACDTKITYSAKDANIIRSDLASGGDNLVISFPYEDGSIDKVDYKIENGTFNLIVIPREGFPKVTPEQVSYSYAGGQSDCFITIGAPTLESLGRLYTENKTVLEQAPLVAIDIHPNNAGFGSANYIRPETASLSELVLDIANALQIEIDEEIATHALNGLMSATNNFSGPATNADVFETAAELMRLGAVRQQTAPPQQMQRTQQQPRRDQPQQPARRDFDNRQNQQPQSGRPVQKQYAPSSRPQGVPNQQQAQKKQSLQQTAPIKPQANSWSDQLPQEIHNQPVNVANDNFDDKDTPQVSEKPQDDAPQDWLKPKIFKGGGFI